MLGTLSNLCKKTENLEYLCRQILLPIISRGWELEDVPKYQVFVILGFLVSNFWNNISLEIAELLFSAIFRQVPFGSAISKADFLFLSQLLDLLDRHMTTILFEKRNTGIALKFIFTFLRRIVYHDVNEFKDLVSKEKALLIKVMLERVCLILNFFYCFILIFPSRNLTGP